jgi:hypothetical protein
MLKVGKTEDKINYRTRVEITPCYARIGHPADSRSTTTPPRVECLLKDGAPA